MNIFVLYDRAGIHSGRALASSLANLGKCTVRSGRPAMLEQLQDSGHKFDYIVNVGWFSTIDPKGAIILNNPSAIAVSSNKLKARVKFSKQDIPAPSLWLEANDIPKEEFPIVARTTHHSKGRGFWLCKTREEAVSAAASKKSFRKTLIKTKKGNRVWRSREVFTEGASHFIKFIKNTREFRVHVMSTSSEVNKDFVILKLSEKKPSPEGTGSGVIKNHDNGWVFSFPDNPKEEVINKVREASKKAIEYFGLHWGAVDVMVSKDTGEVYVLEINSTPSLTDDHANTIDKYTDGIGSLIGIFEPMVSKKTKEENKKVEFKKKKLYPLLNKLGI